MLSGNNARFGEESLIPWSGLPLLFKCPPPIQGPHRCQTQTLICFLFLLAYVYLLHILKFEENIHVKITEFFFYLFLVCYLFLLFFTLQYCVGFAIHQRESATGVHVFPNLNSPPCTIPLGHLSAPAPCIQYHASNLDWRFISYMIIYMFQCYSLKSSHPHPLPQSPKDCSIHLCLFCCITYRVIVTIFLNSIYIH